MNISDTGYYRIIINATCIHKVHYPLTLKGTLLSFIIILLIISSRLTTYLLDTCTVKLHYLYRLI